MTEACSSSSPSSTEENSAHDVRRLISAGLPRGSAPRLIRDWIEGQGWKVAKISLIPYPLSIDKYAVRFDTLGDSPHDVSTRMLHALPYALKKHIEATVEAPRTIHDNTMFTHVYIRQDLPWRVGYYDK